MKYLALLLVLLAPVPLLAQEVTLDQFWRSLPERDRSLVAIGVMAGMQVPVLFVTALLPDDGEMSHDLVVMRATRDTITEFIQNGALTAAILTPMITEVLLRYAGQRSAITDLGIAVFLALWNDYVPQTEAPK